MNQPFAVPTIDQLVKVVRSYLERTDTSPTRFGSLVCGDPNLVSDIEGGRTPGLAKARDILNTIERFPDGIPKPGGKDWSPQEDRVLAQLWGMGLSHLRISEITGRTPSAVVGRAHRRGLPRRNKINDGATAPTLDAKTVTVPPPAIVRGKDLDDDLPVRPVQAQQRKERRCLSCTGWFISEHFGNRVCDPCKTGRDSDVESYAIKVARF